jgi:hypothetical protein
MAFPAWRAYVHDHFDDFTTAVKVHEEELAKLPKAGTSAASSLDQLHAKYSGGMESGGGYAAGEGGE